MNSHRRYARALSLGASCLALAGVAVAAWSWSAATFGVDEDDSGGYLVPIVCFLFTSTFLAWVAKRERAAARQAEGSEKGFSTGQERSTDTNGDT
ncbi:hypothetical protein ACFXKY_15710 [Streptomyces canus]|uniref:hypothetical protein n=1 Tax=Streptomyces canus TaxID=58343 RepID=UPI0036741F2C